MDSETIEQEPCAIKIDEYALIESESYHALMNLVDNLADQGINRGDAVKGAFFYMNVAHICGMLSSGYSIEDVKGDFEKCIIGAERAYPDEDE
jgi:hypothetical protein